MFELKIANAQIVINYANFLEDNDYFEDSFRVYERGVDLFTYPIAFELWNTYLIKFTKRYGGEKLERARDLFEQALDKCPPKYAKPIYLLYGQFEVRLTLRWLSDASQEDYGLTKRAMSVYDRMTRAVEVDDQFEAYAILAAKTTANYGLPATRAVYERAIEVLPNGPTAEMCLRFAALERKLGEIDRARAIYAHASQFCDPRVRPTLDGRADVVSHDPSSGPSGTPSSSITAQKTRSASTCASSEPSRPCTTPKRPTSARRQLDPARRRKPGRRRPRARAMRWPTSRPMPRARPDRRQASSRALALLEIGLTIPGPSSRQACVVSRMRTARPRRPQRPQPRRTPTRSTSTSSEVGFSRRRPAL